MRLKIQNIGMISNADILLNGLTVIAGENDTGKSTVGKILFCLIKTISRYQEDFSESKYHKIEDILNKLYFHIRRTTQIREEEDLDRLRSLFSLDHYLYMEEEEDNDSFIQNLKSYIQELEIEKDSLQLYYKLIDDIITIYSEPEDKNKYIQSALNKVFRSEFDSYILKHNCDIGKIELFENELQLLDISIDINNKITLNQNCQPLYFDDATFIETPLILNNHDLLIRATTGLSATKSTSRRLGIPYTTLHTKDLFDKLKESQYPFPFFEGEETNEINNKISSLIKGELIYDSDDNDFKYIKNEKELPIKNTATGIKAFGILQILADSDFINEKSFLILDEPEIHLHPKWQLKYAELISLLVKQGIPVLVTSHSPYMIEALQKYNNKLENINFYLTNNENVEKINNNNSETLSAIFSKLSEPFEEFDKLDSDKLQNG
jgi:predicted ATPase